MIWETAKIPESELNRLIVELTLPRPIAILLATRSITPESAEIFFQCPLATLSNPYRLPEIEKAAKRLWEAILHKEKILIHGDYDTDGITATSLLRWTLSENGADVSCFIPHRFDDGYGFTTKSLDKAVNNTNYKLLVTVDCGITSPQAVDKANSMGIDVIITDHHEPQNEKPDALAVINPKLHSSLKDLYILAGVGIAFKLCHAFIKYGREHKLGGENIDLRESLDLVALGTISDIVPLKGENRTLVRHGLIRLAKQIRPGIRALCETAGISENIKPSEVTYNLAPRINAAGRFGDAKSALKLLNTSNIIEAYRQAEVLEHYNRQRQSKEEEILIKAKHLVNENINIDDSYSILAAGEEWHQGVIGIVASRLSKEYNRPTIILTINGDRALGSGRSIANLNLIEVLSECGDLLIHFGGHPMAAGLSLNKSNIKKFQDLFELEVRKRLNTKDIIPKIDIDGEVKIAELDEKFFDFLEKLEPFGHSNPQPVFRINRLKIKKAVSAAIHHTRGTLEDERNNTFSFIAFNRNINSFPQDFLDIAAVPQTNKYNGIQEPQLQILQTRVSAQ